MSVDATRCARIVRPIGFYGSIQTSRRRPKRRLRSSKKADAGEVILLRQDEARFPLVPTLRTTLGVKGFRPIVGTWDQKDLVSAFGALTVVSGKLTTRLLDCPARLKVTMGKSTCRYFQETFVRHLRDIARAYPATQGITVVIMIDTAPWHRGAGVTAVLEEFPHLA